MLTATGLGSGLDINSLVTQLVAAERAGSDLQLDRQAAKYNSKFSALGSLKSTLAAFQSSVSTLNTLSNFSKNSVISSDYSKILVSADSTATPNSYSLEVSQLAKSHSLASISFADSDTTALGTGTLSIRHGTTDYNSGTDTYNSFSLNSESTVASITIDSSNNTLEGIMAAINEADAGVNASVVNDGSGYRLLLTSTDTGEENSLELAVSDDDTNDGDALGLSRFAFSSTATIMEQTVAAEDAQFTINGLDVSSASNTAKDSIAGVELTLREVTEGPVSISVDSDISTIANGMGGFIAGYNQFIATANALSSYDAENNVPAVLVGDFTLRSVSSQIDNILRNTVEGLSGTISNLSQLGVTTTSTGALTLDSVVFNKAIEEFPDEVAQMFAAVGVPEDENISFNGASENTVVGNYAVNITTLATSGVYTGSGALPDFGGGGSLDIDDDNDSFTIKIDGIESDEITLTQGNYTSGSALADEIKAQINASPLLVEATAKVEVSYDDATDTFSITSNSLGAVSTVEFISVDSNTAAELGFSVGSGVTGVDVAGTIDGIAGTGTGNVLVASSDSDADGLSLLIDSDTTGSKGNVNFTRGLVNQLDLLMDDLLDEEGALEDRIDSFKDRLKEVDERRAEQELRWEAVEERYRVQFNALDTLLGSLQSTSSYMEEAFKNFVEPNSVKN